MFGLRTKRTTRDRQLGLVFQWRLPVSSHISFLAAIAIVTLLSVVLASTVHVRIGNVARRQPERRGPLLYIPQGAEWHSLRMIAKEAGPFPVREDPARDPAVQALLRDGMSRAIRPGYTYRPQFKEVTVDLPHPAEEEGDELLRGFLPPLPAFETPAAPADPPRSTPPLVLEEKGARAIVPDGPPPAGLLQGGRYLISYDRTGRVLRVFTVSSPPPEAGKTPEEAAAEVDATVGWLRQMRIDGGEAKGGWTAVEISGGS